MQAGKWAFYYPANIANSGILKMSDLMLHLLTAPQG